MPGRITAGCRRTGQPPPREQGEIVRCIVDSLALAHRRAIRRVQELPGRHVDIVHVVGGGACNCPLCQLTAETCGLPVEAGPVEAKAPAFGNVLVRARSFGAAPRDLAGMRALLRGNQHMRRFESAGDGSA